MSQQLSNIIQTANPERLQRAVDGLADGQIHVYLLQTDSDSLAGSVINGDSKEYACSIAAGHVSCECKDQVYRHGTCKHLLAFALQVLRAEEGVQEEQACA